MPVLGRAKVATRAVIGLLGFFAMKKIGLLVGRERSFPDALIAEVARISGGAVLAEYASLDLTRVDDPPVYDVLVDRISHDIACYQPILKVCALRGAHVVNNPFWRIADDKAFGTALAARLGVPIPKTYILPSKAYGDDVNAQSLTNLRYPLDWDGMVATLGLPIFLKPHWGGGFRDVHRVTTREELMRVYDGTGRTTMIAQEAIEWTQYVRCIVIGTREVLALPWDPRLSHFERYSGAAATMPPLAPALLETIEAHARTLCDALGYDMNTCEFGVRDGVPYAIDFMNSAPDFDLSSLGQEPFSWTVSKMSAFLVRLAEEPPPTHYRWDAMLAGRARDARD
jgi:glutathione synthase/RimK-type ligase-like ATP-grasp enzyme